MDLNLVFLFHSELTKFEEILIDYKRYKELLFKLSPPEWQEDQRTKASKAKVRSDGDARDKQNMDPEESDIRNGKYLVHVKKVNQHQVDYEEQGNTGFVAVSMDSASSVI